MNAITRTNFEPIITAVQNAVDSENTRRAYADSLRLFFDWYTQTGQPTLGRSTVQAFKAHLQEQDLSASTINRHLSAVRKLAEEAELNGALDSTVARGIRGVKGVRSEGHTVGNWLTLEQARELINSPNTRTLKGLRDRALLAVLIGCGLRRDEAVSLTFEHIQQRDGRWVIVDLIGKRNKVRSVPMPSWAKKAIDEWATAAKTDTGYVFLPINKSGRISGSQMSPQALYFTVRAYANGTGVSPHDLRRTFAKLAHKGGAGLDQIQLSLGHASIQTTERYLGVEQDLTDAPCDYIKL